LDRQAVIGAAYVAFEQDAKRLRRMRRWHDAGSSDRRGRAQTTPGAAIATSEEQTMLELPRTPGRSGSPCLIAACAVVLGACATDRDASPDQRNANDDIAVEVTPLPDDIVIDRDIELVMIDGIKLYANVYRPPTSASEPVPVIVALLAYGKDLPAEIGFVEQEIVFRELGLSFGEVTISEATPFEAPDPAFWVPRGYAVMHVDLRGFGKSEGNSIFGMFGSTEVYDFGQIIEWAGTQSWSNGKVALMGVSYLAIAQWYAAAANPEHLTAIIPWEGASDLYRDILYHGGIPGLPGPDERLPPLPSAGEAETFFQLAPLLASIPPLDLKRIVAEPRLVDIQVPALICGSFSDQGLHTRGSFNAFVQISSEHRWLYTHGGGKWEQFYGESGLDYQLAFLDHFLRGQMTDIMDRARVRLEVRKTRDEFEIRNEPFWPIENTDYQTLFLDAATETLSSKLPATAASAQYEATEDDQVTFDLQFDRRTEVTGHMKLKLWVSTSEGDDMDLIIGIKKLDADGVEIPFWGPEKNPDGLVAQGWLRVSQRELDPQRSQPHQPVLAHRQELKITANEIVPVEIEILPSSTLFEAGETLRLVVRGTDSFSGPYHRHTQLLNQGQHSVHTGGSHDSQLLIPFIPRADQAVTSERDGAGCLIAAVSPRATGVGQLATGILLLVSAAVLGRRKQVTEGHRTVRAGRNAPLQQDKVLPRQTHRAARSTASLRRFSQGSPLVRQGRRLGLCSVPERPTVGAAGDPPPAVGLQTTLWPARSLRKLGKPYVATVLLTETLPRRGHWARWRVFHHSNVSPGSRRA
jgi:uncharacterized protein